MPPSREPNDHSDQAYEQKRNRDPRSPGLRPKAYSRWQRDIEKAGDRVVGH
jgi:hypothetical protein